MSNINIKNFLCLSFYYNLMLLTGCNSNRSVLGIDDDKSMFSSTPNFSVAPQFDECSISSIYLVDIPPDVKSDFDTFDKYCRNYEDRSQNLSRILFKSEVEKKMNRLKNTDPAGFNTSLGVYMNGDEYRSHKANIEFSERKIREFVNILENTESKPNHKECIGILNSSLKNLIDCIENIRNKNREMDCNIFTINNALNKTDFFTQFEGVLEYLSIKTVKLLALNAKYKYQSEDLSDFNALIRGINNKLDKFHEFVQKAQNSPDAFVKANYIDSSSTSSLLMVDSSVRSRNSSTRSSISGSPSSIKSSYSDSSINRSANDVLKSEYMNSNFYKQFAKQYHSSFQSIIGSIISKLDEYNDKINYKSKGKKFIFAVQSSALDKLSNELKSIFGELAEIIEQIKNNDKNADMNRKSMCTISSNLDLLNICEKLYQTIRTIKNEFINHINNKLNDNKSLIKSTNTSLSKYSEVFIKFSKSGVKNLR